MERITQTLLFLFISVATALLICNLFHIKCFSGLVESIQILSTAIVVVVTFLIYKLNTEAKKADNYFEKISEQFFNINELHYALTNLRSTTDDMIQRNRFEIQIKASCNLMIYYLMHYPNNSYDNDRMIVTLLSISKNPYLATDFETLSKEFNELCITINQKHQQYVTIQFPKTNKSSIN